MLAVTEYFQFDVEGDWIPEYLRGYTLTDGVYVPIERNPTGRLPSATLGLELGLQPLGVEGGEHAKRLRFFRPRATSPLPIFDEYVEQGRQERERADEASQRAEQAEAEVARLRAELEALRGDRPDSD